MMESTIVAPNPLMDVTQQWLVMTQVWGASGGSIFYLDDIGQLLDTYQYHVPILQCLEKAHI